jgi:hypothetical protein
MKNFIKEENNKKGDRMKTEIIPNGSLVVKRRTSKHTDRNWFLIKQGKGSSGEINIGKIVVPKEFVGERMVIRLERLQEEEKRYYVRVWLRNLNRYHFYNDLTLEEAKRVEAEQKRKRMGRKPEIKEMKNEN